MAYQPGIPTGSVPLNQDYLNIQGNFGSLNTQFNEDHVPLTSTSGIPPNGYHKAVHLVPQLPPVATPGYGELYCRTTNDGYSTAEQLFYQFVNASAVTINIGMTRNFAPLVATNGYTFLPGGMVLQWGQAASKSVGSAIAFNMPFTSGPFSITLTPYNFGYDANSHGAPSAIGATTTQFFISNGTAQASTYDLYWMAIGN